MPYIVVVGMSTSCVVVTGNGPHGKPERDP